MRSVRIAFALLAILLPTFASARDAAELQLALKKLTVLGGALHIAAHPDDENTALLSYLASERLVRAGYLSVTRGDGGQNLVGEEKGELLGVIRTQELLAARRLDGAEQYFTRAIDFGYTKSPTETLSIWDHDKVLADVVYVIRKFQPDVVIARFPATGEGGHGQHTASAILAAEAFAAAGDATKYPEQLSSVRVWKPRRLFWNRFSWQRIEPNDPIVANDVKVDLGTYNPLLGRAYTEIAAQSRSQHKSQGFGAAERRGSIINYFNQLAGDPAKTDLFEGIDTSWSRYPGGEAVGKLLQQASDGFDLRDPAKTLPLLIQAYDQLDRLAARPEWAPNVNPWVEIKRRELLDAIRDAAGISIDVAAGDSSVVPGGEIPVSVTVVNRSNHPFRLASVAAPNANPGKAPGTPLKYNQPVKVDIALRLAGDTAYSQPYWLRHPAQHGLYTVREQELIGLPDNRAALPITVALDDDMMHSFIFTVPAVFRWTDAVRGEQVRNVDVVPDVTANFATPLYVFPDAKAKRVDVDLRSFGATAGTVRLLTPAGWKVEPASLPVSFAKKGSEASVSFTVTPPAGASTGDLTAQVELPDGRKLSSGLTTIDYPHIPAQRIFSAATAKLLRSDIKKRGTRIGYIMGAGDDVPAALQQVGYQVDLLSDADLDRGDFSRFDAIVTGVRAYNTRNRLVAHQPKLMQYVENGGTLVVQMNSLNPQPLLIASPAPLPITISNERITVENAPVTVTAPDHPLLNTPNKLTVATWEGWVQERGLYFPKQWDPAYTTPISMNDPNEPAKAGGILVAKHGKGTFIYTPLAFFRQLPAGVEGAYELFVNMVSARQQ
jgi:LmbE family N-acetylglucosaminyl deacetylase